MAPPLLPSTRLMSCPACAEHVKVHESSCPHCGAEIGGSRLTGAAAVLMGLALTACPGKGGDTDSASTTMTIGSDSTTDSGESGSSGTSGSDTVQVTSSSMPEPEYGVPVTTTTAEPDYGVPSTDPTTGTTGATDATETDSATETDTDSSTETDSDTVGEPEYGVPQTTSSTTLEPDYGVPQTTGTT